MSLEKAPPSRYRVEEKNGRLIVHDSLNGVVIGNEYAKRPADRSGTALDSAQRKGSALNLVARADSALEVGTNSPSPAFKGPLDQEQAKRGAIVAIVGIAIALFAILTWLWVGLLIAFIIAPVRQAIIDRLLPAIKLYIAEGRWG